MTRRSYSQYFKKQQNLSRERYIYFQILFFLSYYSTRERFLWISEFSLTVNSDKGANKKIITFDFPHYNLYRKLIFFMINPQTYYRLWTIVIVIYNYLLQLIFVHVELDNEDVGKPISEFFGISGSAPKVILSFPSVFSFFKVYRSANACELIRSKSNHWNFQYRYLPTLEMMMERNLCLMVRWL